MLKRILLLFFIAVLFVPCAFADDDEGNWQKYIDVYDSGGLDKPVTQKEFEKAIDTVKGLQKKKKKPKLKKDEFPEPFAINEPIQVDNTNVVKVTSRLYYDGQIVPVGFYKITAKKEEDGFYINLVQGQSDMVKVKAQKVNYMSFCPTKTNCIQTEVYKEKYFKIYYKDIDNALVGFLAIMD
ncbi:MAG: hypothetical protein PHX18_01955 [Candidatus Gastranaerophilales bacterium]|nr:hypothetical protein [Candidatus Gastranaerophilales bacterium]